ncbi:ATP-binding protein [Rhizorhabdus phycosphaerae]|uniref:ATP-binding protein n=1 Tax=Rhizorhabdus phycosphaerae TaxID=2711156 RepID=UPI0013EBB826|nr:ATP-binding protein [Rhizorhabdus phycosphaerae]
MSHMIQLDPIAAMMLAIIVALWVAAAVAAIVMGLRRDAIAKARARDLERQAALLGSCPALPFRVGLDGRIGADTRLAHWLGLTDVPATIDAMATHGEGGISVVDAEGLAADVQAANQAGRPFERILRLAGSDRVLLARGRPAPVAVGDGVIVWLFDNSEAERTIARLSHETGLISDALDSCLALIEAAPFPMWHRGPDLKLALVNSAYVEAVEGDSAEDVVTRGVELIDAADGRAPRATALTARDTGRINTQVVPVTLSGQRRTMRIVDVPMGEHGVAGYAFDIQDLEQTRAELGRFQEVQRELFDRLSAGVAQFGADRSLIFFNQPFVQFFALAPEWLTDRPEFDRILERLREAQRLPEVRDFPGWRNERRAWFNAVDAVEETWTLPGGQHLRVVAQPLPNGGLLLFFEDRTEQVQLSSARDTLLRVRAATFENLFEAIGVFAADGRLHIWNQSFRDIWGLSDADLAQNLRVDAMVELVGAKLADPSRAQLLRDLVRIATVDRQARTGRMALADGRYFDFAVVPLPDGNALFTLLDITASRGIEEALRGRADALEEADKLKTAFVANMSYELRVPLTSIAGFAELLDGGYAGELPPVAGEYVKAILSSVGRLGSLVEDVLDLTQGAAGSLPLAEEPVDLGEVLSEAVAAARKAADAKPLNLIVDMEPELGTMRGDPRRLRQIADHLLNNAITYTPPQGRVTIRVHGDDDMIIWTVADTGPGMDPAQRARIFDSYPRIDASNEEGKQLIGIGLPLTRQLVEAHGGSIALDSEPGRGTTVTIHLPRRLGESVNV